MYFPLPFHSDSHLWSVNIVMYCKNRSENILAMKLLQEFTIQNTLTQTHKFDVSLSELFFAHTHTQKKHTSLHSKCALSVRKCVFTVLANVTWVICTCLCYFIVLWVKFRWAKFDQVRFSLYTIVHLGTNAQFWVWVWFRFWKDHLRRKETVFAL